MVNQKCNNSKDIFVHMNGTNETNVKSINTAINEFCSVSKNSNLLSQNIQIIYILAIASFNYTVT